MDTIFVNDLVIHTTIGDSNWEIAVKQPVTISLAITTANFLQAPIDCTALVNNIIKLSNDNFNKLEVLVAKIEQLIVNCQNNIINLEIIAKRLFVLPNVKEIGVKIARSYPNS